MSTLHEPDKDTYTGEKRKKITKIPGDLWQLLTPHASNDKEKTTCWPLVGRRAAGQRQVQLATYGSLVGTRVILANKDAVLVL